MPEQTELTAAGPVPELGLATSRSLGAVAEPLLVGLAGLLLASVVAAADGGYFSDSWAWLALVSLCVATLRLILVPTIPLRRLDWAFAGGLGAFAGWVALSARWAPAVTPAVDETIRGVAYAAVVLALLLVVRRRTVEPLLVGALAGVTLISTYTLLTRLQPDRVGDWDPATLFRLSGPIGYWNGLGVYAAMGTLLALGLVARSTEPRRAGARGSGAGAARADDAVHVQPRRLARARRRARRGDRARRAPPAAGSPQSWCWRPGPPPCFCSQPDPTT